MHNHHVHMQIWQHRLLQPKTRTLPLSHLFFFFLPPSRVCACIHDQIFNSPLDQERAIPDDLNEKKQSFRRNVVSLAAELKEEAETKARHMEEEIFKLQTRLEERNGQLQASASAAEKVTYINSGS
ncbi:hypothetical protein F383_15712 [Gossypium arboreum]|uniref:Uncharacterized protein n=1 Tax=Gossypium arboreum TaxID=29729 RepID=A0A0B0NB85_GOSAR|nr:hypothetical protein F383_15712 [Gossypium arboreum]